MKVKIIILLWVKQWWKKELADVIFLGCIRWLSFVLNLEEAFNENNEWYSLKIYNFLHARNAKIFIKDKRLNILKKYPNPQTG